MMLFLGLDLQFELLAVLLNEEDIRVNLLEVFIELIQFLLLVKKTLLKQRLQLLPVFLRAMFNEVSEIFLSIDIDQKRMKEDKVIEAGRILFFFCELKRVFFKHSLEPSSPNL